MEKVLGCHSSTSAQIDPDADGIKKREDKAGGYSRSHHQCFFELLIKELYDDKYDIDNEIYGKDTAVKPCHDKGGKREQNKELLSAPLIKE